MYISLIIATHNTLNLLIIYFGPYPARQNSQIYKAVHILDAAVPDGYYNCCEVTEAMNDHNSATPVENEADAYAKQQRHLMKSLNKLVDDIASEMGISLTTIQCIDGRRLGCRDAHLVKIGKDGNLASTIIHESELDMNDDSARTERARCKIRDVLTKLRQQANHQ